jgi:hypothetical protein
MAGPSSRRRSRAIGHVAPLPDLPHQGPRAGARADRRYRRLCGEADQRSPNASRPTSQHRITVDRGDFQIPPASSRWYGILTETGSRAALWNGADWTEYPRRAYTRSMKAFDTEEAALDWARSQPDRHKAHRLSCRSGRERARTSAVVVALDRNKFLARNRNQGFERS